MTSIYAENRISRRHIMMRKSVLIACMLLVAALPAFCQTFQWQSYTNTDDIRDIVWFNEAIWCATSGGLMAYYPESESVQVWTNSEGLTYNNLQAVGIDLWDRIWVGMSNGHINIIDPEDNSIAVRDDMEGEIFEVTAITTSSEWVLVGHDNGLAIYREGEGSGNVQIAETIPRFGGFPSQERVSDIVVLDRDIWVSTSYGVAQASVDDAPLRPPTVWNTYTIYQGLPNNNVLALTTWQGMVIAGTEAGVARFNGQQFEPMGNLTDIIGVYGTGDSLWAWTEMRMYQWNGSQWESVGGTNRYITSVTADTQGRLWAGHENKTWTVGALAYLSDGQWSDRIVQNGLSWNKVNAVYIDSHRGLWVSGEGVNLLDETGWHNWTKQDPYYTGSFFNNQGREIIEDPYGGIWLSSFGGGVMHARDIVNDTLIYDLYTYTEVENPWLTGVPEDIYYVVVQDMVMDHEDNLWLVDRGVVNGKMLVQVPNSYLQDPQPEGPNTWNYVSVLSEALDADQEALFVDDYNRIWVAGGDPNDCPGQIYVLDGGVENPTWTVLSFEDPIYINEMALDHTGTLWFATRDGVKYAVIPQDLSTFNMQPFYGAISGTVQCVHVDAQNNKWFGTDLGVSVLSAAFTWSHHFPSGGESLPLPGGLVGANVQKITSNYTTGEVWIATTTGLSLVKTPYRESGGPLSTIKVFPNPFHADGGNRLQFKTVDFHRALFYSITGKKIRELNSVEAIMGWDGRDDEGDLVGSGIYLIMVTNTAGDSKLGKVAVVR